MNSLRKWLYRPRRDDKSLLAKFWYADDNLNRVAAELDSFDGRKDPERCAALVSRLRSCQDKLLNICNRMLDELDGAGGRATREFRQKFPDEIVTDNLGGQLWFGAECLAAGSSIMNKEFESEQMRPLAKAVTKTLEKVRSYLREQCLSPTPHYTEEIHENLKIFDRLFAEFEFSYVSCMVHVKTIKEFEIQQDVICLFSDTLQRAITNQMISQEMVDFYDPSLMFAIPRLAIVCGLIIFPTGPLNVDRDNSDFPELFRPFKNLLRKIRDLLWTLSPGEFYVLEKLLCQLEEPTDLERKLKAAQKELDENSKIAASADQAAKLDAKLVGENAGQTSTTPNRTNCDTNSETATMIDEIVQNILIDVIKESTNDNDCDQSDPCQTQVISKVPSKKVSKVPTTMVEIDCSGPDIMVAQVRSECSTCSSSEPNSQGSEQSESPVRPDSRRRQRLRVVDSEASQIRQKQKSVRRKGTKKYPKSGKDARARFKSSEDLIHRLYVCISGAADQLQTNFAGDFRSILKYVFVMNSSVDEEEETADNDDKSQESLSLSDNDSDAVDGVELSPDIQSPDEDSLDQGETQSQRVVVTAIPQNSDSYECGEDALMNETEQSYLRNFSGDQSIPSSERQTIDPRLLSTSPPAGLASMPVYASNLDYHLGDHGVLGGEELQHSSTYYQPEPTLLTIASGEGAPTEEQEQGRSRVVEPPPPWIPDSMAPLCMGCGSAFSLVKRRHHCRSCGRVFCAKCSPNQVPLPRYGMQKAVRVCNRCYIYYMNPYEERTAHAYHVYSGTGHGSWGYSGMVS